LASGVPDAQAVPLLLYPYFALTYRSGHLNLWHDCSLMPLFGVSTLMLVAIGLIVVHLSSSKRDALVGLVASLLLILLADLQVLYWPATRDGSVRSLVQFNGTALACDPSRVFFSSLLVGLGVAIGCGYRYRKRASRQSPSDPNETGIWSRVFFSPFCRLIGIVLALETIFLVLRDKSGGDCGYTRLAAFPGYVVMGSHLAVSDGSRTIAGIAAVLFLAMIGFYAGGKLGSKLGGGLLSSYVVVLLLLMCDEVSGAGFYWYGIGVAAKALPLGIGLVGAGWLLRLFVGRVRRNPGSDR
jgi:hypothetical protein